MCIRDRSYHCRSKRVVFSQLCSCRHEQTSTCRPIDRHRHHYARRLYWIKCTFLGKRIWNPNSQHWLCKQQPMGLDRWKTALLHRSSCFAVGRTVLLCLLPDFRKAQTLTKTINDFVSKSHQRNRQTVIQIEWKSWRAASHQTVPRIRFGFQQKEQLKNSN